MVGQAESEADRREEAMLRDLLDPSHLPVRTTTASLRTTHISRVILADHDVFKIKRAKDYGFLDYRSLEARKRFAEAEVRLNRRTAPDVYVDVLPIYHDEKGYAMNRPGEIVDWAVHMRRLPDERSARALVRNGVLGRRHLEALARCLARFFREAEPVLSWAPMFFESVEENFTQTADFAPDVISKELLDAVVEGQRQALGTLRGAIEARPGRDGHGDLRLEHVYFLDEDKPVIIDCIEFNERFRWGDPGLDLAFLAMDFHREGRGDLAEEILALSSFEMDDVDFYPLIDFYESYRAFVRGKVAGFVSRDPAAPDGVACTKRQEAREYFELARSLLDGPGGTPFLLCVGGVIGVGKTTVARALAAGGKAVHLAADAIRKHLAGVGHHETAPAEAYTEEFTEKVQAELLRRARVVLETHRSVVLDTTFCAASLRKRAKDLAREMAALFHFFECRAPETVLRERLRAREGGLSDAREELLPRFLEAWETEDELDVGEKTVIDTTRPVQELGDLVREFWKAAAASERR